MTHLTTIPITALAFPQHEGATLFLNATAASAAQHGTAAAVPPQTPDPAAPRSRQPRRVPRMDARQRAARRRHGRP
eukprot:143176-Chlamydomonas_euryale.AAC.4